MKTQVLSLIKLSLITAAVCGSFTAAKPALAQGTAFTYQGQLSGSNGPVTGVYDVTFALYNAGSGGSQVGSTITDTAVGVTNGLFTVLLDFDGVFNGTAYWLQIGVRSNGVGSYTPLSPRQELTPTPYAITAENLDGTVLASQLTGILPSGLLSGVYGNALNLNNPANSFTGNGSGLTGVNAATLSGLGTNSFWQTRGNAGTTAGVNFLGPTDNQALEVKVFNTRALRIEPGVWPGLTNIPNIIGGSPGNFVAPGTVGNVIGGGADYLEGYTNLINAANYNTIGGGVGNQITNGAYDATISGGEFNAVGATAGAIGGGDGNAVTGDSATVPGGFNNLAAGLYSFAAGQSARAMHAGAFVWADSQGGALASTANDQFLARANGGMYFYNGTNGVNLDQFNANNGSINYGLRFGVASGEGIGSKRTAGGDQYGLDFYTAFTNRMSIVNNGFVGINTTNPLAQLHVIKGGLSGQGDGYGGGPAILADTSTSDGIYVGTSAGLGYAFWGVATASGGRGVDGEAPGGGIGVYGSTSTGTGVYATAGTGSALTIGHGAIHVSGAGTNANTAAFIHLTVSTNISANYTVINNSLCNGDPNAILLVTPNLSPQGTLALYNNHPIGVWYNGANWTIFEQDNAAMPVGEAFNVMIIKN